MVVVLSFHLTYFWKVRTTSKGRGVFTTRPFRKNDMICDYKGELISWEEGERREALKESAHCGDSYTYFFRHELVQIGTCFW